MAKAITFCLVVVGLVNFAPLLGVVSAQKLESAYGITLNSNDLIILMRHRALMFGLLGGFVLVSAFFAVYQIPAMIMAAVSMVGYAILVHSVGDYNPSIHKVLVIDYVGIVFLVVAAILKYVGHNR